MKVRGTAAAILLLLALLSGCADDSGSSLAADPEVSDSSSTSAATPSEGVSLTPGEEKKEPQCSDIWVEGRKLPWGYEDCYDGDRRVKANGRYCEIGKPLITYRDNWYAAPGGPVNRTDGPLAQDPGYQKAVKACGG